MQCNLGPDRIVIAILPLFARAQAEYRGSAASLSNLLHGRVHHRHAAIGGPALAAELLLWSTMETLRSTTLSSPEESRGNRVWEHGSPLPTRVEWMW